MDCACACSAASSTQAQINPQLAASAAVSASPSKARPFARARAHQPRQVKCAAEIWHEPELGREQLQKCGGARRQHDVAQQRETHAGTRGDAIHRNHHGYAQLIPGIHHGVEIIPQPRADILASAALRIAE